MGVGTNITSAAGLTIGTGSGNLRLNPVGDIDCSSKDITDIGTNITGSGALTISAGGNNKDITLVPTGTGEIQCSSKDITDIGTNITGSGALTISAGGNNKDITLVPTGTGEIQCSSKNITGVGTNITSTFGLTIGTGSSNLILNPFGSIDCSSNDITGVGTNITGSNNLTINATGSITLNPSSTYVKIATNDKLILGDDRGSFPGAGELFVSSNPNTVNLKNTDSSYSLNIYSSNTILIETDTNKDITLKPGGTGKIICSNKDISGAGNIIATGTISASSFNATSDRRIKSNIVSLHTPTINNDFTVDHLNPVTFFNTITNKNDIGFIAQEVEEVYPFMVNSDNEYKSLNYISIIGLLVKEIQDLKKEIRELKK